MEELKRQLQAGIAWLEGLAAGGDAVPATPDADTLAAMSRALALNITPDTQRDASAEIPDDVVVQLKKPLRLVAGEGMVLEALRFRTPSYGEIKRFQAIAKQRGPAQQVTEGLVLLSEDKLTAADVDRMKSLDVDRCSEALEPFLQLLPRN